jgi:hypothetical protein
VLIELPMVVGPGPGDPHPSAPRSRDHHRTDRATWRVDLARRERFEDAGWRVVLVGDDDLRGRAASTLVSRIRRHLDDDLRRAGTL